MAKEIREYFSHDYNARGDKRMIALRKKERMAGVGLYWCIIEMLYEAGGYLPLNDIENTCYELRVKPQLVNRILNDFDLFRNDGERFWSESVLERMELRREKSGKARESAKSRWNEDKPDAIALRTHSERNAIKEKESKEKEKESKESVIEIGEPIGTSISIKPKYAGEKPRRIYSLMEYFAMTGQLDEVIRAGWREKFGPFMNKNPGAVFNDDSHLYNAVKRFDPSEVNGQTRRKPVDLKKQL